MRLFPGFGAVTLLFSFTLLATDSLNFEDPYVEVVPERWNFAGISFGGWPPLPEAVQQNITQVIRGYFNSVSGVWLYCNRHIYFVWQKLPTGSSSFGQSLLQFLDLNEILPFDVVNSLTVEGTRIVSDTDGSLACVATPSHVYVIDCRDAASCRVKNAFEPPSETFGNIKAVVISYSDKRLWVGSSHGLWTINVMLESVEYVRSQLVTSLTWRSASLQHEQFFSCNNGAPLVPVGQDGNGRNEMEFGVLAVGGGDHLAFYDGHKWWQEWVSRWGAGVGGVVDGPVSAMTFDLYGRLWIGNNISLSLLNLDYTFDRIGPRQGLPYGNITSILFVPGDETDGGILTDRLWLGTTKGAAVMDIVSWTFSYYYGPRWHSGDSVTAMGWLGENVTVMAVSGGLTAFRPEVWTLSEKAEHYEAMIDRHTREPGLVADCSVTNFVSNSCVPHTTDNDGLWTSIVLASELFRYHITRSLDAHKKIIRQFAGMQFLNEVTGICGLMARSVVRDNVVVSGGIWYNSTTKRGWKWKADTSSDEVVGHMFVLPLVYDLLQNDSNTESRDAQSLVNAIVGYIVTNGFQLIDKSGKHTRWGVWSPIELNTESHWADERGLNSLQILSYLLSAYRMTGNVTFVNAWQMLYNGMYRGVPTEYGRNMINQKVTFPLDDNYSDDELAFLPYFTYFYSLKHLEMEDILSNWRVLEISRDAKISLERAWKVVVNEGSSLWTAIYLYSTGLSDRQSMERIVRNLRDWPLELIQWRVENSHRLDILFNREPDRNRNYNTQSDKILPANERCQYRWNANPFQLDDGGSSIEYDPGAWLLPYWMTRWLSDIQQHQRSG